MMNDSPSEQGQPPDWLAHGVHPATLAVDRLVAQCDVTRLRRSGPGGQHRNKVETGIRILHRPTGLRAEATERRSQAQNQAVAIFRLRLRLAVGVRRAPESLDATVRPSPLWCARLSPGGRLHVAPTHDDFPALLAEALDALATSQWEPPTAATELRCTTNQLVRLIKSHRPAFELANRCRADRGLPPLR